jgi:hypothetical protein
MKQIHPDGRQSNLAEKRAGENLRFQGELSVAARFY